MSVTRIGEFQAAEGKAEELHDFLKSLVPYITSSDGCLSCEVLRHADSQDCFVVVEKWRTKEAHRASVEGFPKDDMQAAMSLFAAPPKGAYYSA